MNKVLSEDVSALEAPLSPARATSPDHKCPQCHHETSNRGLCTECMSDKCSDPETRFADRAGEAKMIMSHQERQRRAHASAGVSASVTARAAGGVRHADNEARLVELGIYVSLESKIVQARDAITELVRAGGKREDLRRAMQEGVAAANEPEETIFTGTQGPLGGGYHR